MEIKRTSGSDPDFMGLVRQSDALYRELFGAAMEYFEPFNKVDSSGNAVVVYRDDLPVACGCFRPFSEDTVEIKRMFVLPEFRNQGIATAVLQALEEWAAETGYRHSVLETSISLTEAIALYNKHGYRQIENWGHYAGVTTSLCMGKKL